MNIDLDDFKSCGWKDVLAEAPCEGYYGRFRAFESAARRALDEGRETRGQIFSLFAKACSMYMKSDNFNEPFGPMFVANGCRTAIPDDFSEEELVFFSEIVEQIDDALLKARLSDLAWLRLRKVEFALTAIDAYRSIPLSENKIVWRQENVDECWERALFLARMLKEPAKKHLEEMETAIINAFDRANREKDSLALPLASLLKEHKLGRKRADKIAEKLEMFAKEFKVNSGFDLYEAQDYFNGAIPWFQQLKRNDKVTEMNVNIAECWEGKAELAISNERLYFEAASFFQSAIQSYQDIPQKERHQYGIGERLSKLRKHLDEYGKLALTQTASFTHPIDITKMVEHAQNMVKGKTLLEALHVFTSYPNPEVEQLHKQALQHAHQNPLLADMPKTVIAKDGRVVAKILGMSLDENTSDDEAALRFFLLREYDFHEHLTVSSYILPALESLILEHHLRERDFVDIAKRSPLVPKGREKAWGKGLFYGFEQDFITAIHLLIPQLEHLVRCCLKGSGVVTTNLDDNGIETEKGLSTLMELPETQDIMGKDLVFEIRSLFCDACGPNLRNELAHGLLDDVECQSHHAIYAWWFCLKLVLRYGYGKMEREKTDES